MTPSRSRRIWLVQVGEELPDDHGPPRLLRTAILARELARRGHDVTFWNARFNHQQKVLRPGQKKRFRSVDGYDVRLLDGRAYQRNVSPARIVSQWENARDFIRSAKLEPRPDVILCGMPSIELADAVAQYARETGVPFAIDCRDMWPEVIEDRLPRAIRMAVLPLIRHWTIMRNRALATATAITGISDPFVEWALSKAGRNRSPLDRAFHLSIPLDRPTNAEVTKANTQWSELLGPITPHTRLGVFAGTISGRLDLITIAQAVNMLNAETKRHLLLIVCGRGDAADDLAKVINGENIVMAGWRSAADLAAIMERADFGLLPYPPLRDFSISFPNKVGEYLSYGLPIMTGIEGITGNLLQKRGLLMPYQSGNIESAKACLENIVSTLSNWRARRVKAKQAFHDFFDPATIFPDFADYVENLSDNSR